MKKKVVSKKVPHGKAKGWDKQMDKELPEHAKGKAKGHDKIEERQDARQAMRDAEEQERQDARQAMRDAKTLQELNRMAEEVKVAKKRQNYALVIFVVLVAAAVAFEYFYG